MFLLSLLSIVKPYIPYDVIASDYTLPMARNANNEMLPMRKLTVPSWVVDTDIPLLPVQFPVTVTDTIQQAIQRKKLKYCRNKQEAIELITQVRKYKYLFI